MLDGAKAGYGSSEGDPLLRILNGIVQCGLCSAYCTRGELCAAEIQDIKGDVMTFADLPDEVVDRDLRVVQDQRPRRRPAQPHLVFFGSGRDTRVILLDDEAAELFAVHLSEGHEQVG